MLKQCSFSTHWNYVEQNMLRRHRFFNYLKLIIEKMLNEFGFFPIKITSKQVRQNDFNFSSIAITSKSTSKWHGSFSIFSFRCMEVIYWPWFIECVSIGMYTMLHKTASENLNDFNLGHFFLYSSPILLVIRSFMIEKIFNK